MQNRAKKPTCQNDRFKIMSCKKQAVPRVMQKNKLFHMSCKKSKLFHMSCKNRAKPCKKASCSTCCKNPNFDTMSRETTSQPAASKALPTDLVPQKSSRSLGIFKEQDHRHCDDQENSCVHRTGFFLREIQSRTSQ